MLNGSTETQILNSTDTAAAVRPSSPPRPPGPCLSRGDIQFAAAHHQCSSSSSIPSTGSCDVDAAPATGAATYPLYSLASSRSVPYRYTSVPYCGIVHSTAWQSPASSQPVIYTAAGNARHPDNTSLACGIDHNHQSATYVPPATSHIVSGSGGLYTAVPTSGGFTAARSAVDNFRYAMRLPQARTHVSAPYSCSQPAVLTDVTSTAVTSDFSRPPVTLTASSSQETIEIHLDSSPGRAETRDQFTVVRGTTADRNRRRRPKSSTIRDRHTSVNTGRRPRCRNTADDSDTERLTSLLRQLKVVVTANRNPEVARLLNEVCEAARGSPVLPASQPVCPAVENLSPTVQQLQSEIAQLNRLECICDDLMIFRLILRFRVQLVRRVVLRSLQ